jgi:hypothetical protein
MAFDRDVARDRGQAVRPVPVVVRTRKHIGASCPELHRVGTRVGVGCCDRRYQRAGVTGGARAPRRERLGVSGDDAEPRAEDCEEPAPDEQRRDRGPQPSAAPRARSFHHLSPDAARRLRVDAVQLYQRPPAWTRRTSGQLAPTSIDPRVDPRRREPPNPRADAGTRTPDPFITRKVWVSTAVLESPRLAGVFDRRR